LGSQPRASVAGPSADTVTHTQLVPFLSSLSSTIVSPVPTLSSGSLFPFDPSVSGQKRPAAARSLLGLLSTPRHCRAVVNGGVGMVVAATVAAGGAAVATVRGGVALLGDDDVVVLQ
jgi:hypothetical protein